MSCNGECKKCNACSNGSYMSDDSLGLFHKWYADTWNLVYPDKPIGDKSIKTITIVSNEDCNFKCSYCYQQHKTPKRLTKEIAKKIVDFILDDEKLNNYADSKTNPCVILDFIGGEPLLNIDVIDYFVDYFKYKATILNHIWATNYMVNMSSNGSLYTKPKVQEFIKKNNQHVSIGISIDGTKQLHDSCRVYPDGRGTYDDVIKNINVWKTQRATTTTKITIAPENLPYIPEAIIHLFDIGFDTVSANVVFEDVWSDINYAKQYYVLLKELADKIIDNDLYKTHYTSLFSEIIGTPIPETDNQNWCGGDGSMIAFGTDGTVYPCLRYMSFAMINKREPLVIGHVDTKIDAKEDSKIIQDLTKITRRSQSTDECFYCPIAKGCAWCSALNYDLFGTADKRTTYICDMHKARVLANRYFWQKLYLKLDIKKEFEFHVPKEMALKIISSEEYDMLLNLK